MVQDLRHTIPVALVTGSSRGIGLGAALALARAGFHVAVNGPDDDRELAHAVEAVRETGATALAAPFDVTDIAGHDGHLHRIEATLGPLTTLVNNAGTGVLSRGDLLAVSEESYDRCLAVNAKAVFFLTQAFAKRLLARARDPQLFHSIINITSANAVAVAASRGEYCVSKAAAAMTAKAFAVRLGAENIAVYDVQPGLVDTAMTAPVIERYRQQAADGLTLLPRVSDPDEIGTIVASLATGQLPYTTGQTISADGGMLLQRF